MLKLTILSRVPELSLLITMAPAMLTNPAVASSIVNAGDGSPSLEWHMDAAGSEHWRLPFLALSMHLPAPQLIGTVGLALSLIVVERLAETGVMNAPVQSYGRTSSKLMILPEGPKIRTNRARQQPSTLDVQWLVATAIAIIVTVRDMLERRARVRCDPVWKRRRPG